MREVRVRAELDSAAQSLRGRPAVRTVHISPVGSVLVTLDRPRLVSLAESHDAVIELVYLVGTMCPTRVRCSMCTGSRRLLAGDCGNKLNTGAERTLDDDPAFAFRVMADVGIKALYT